MNQKIEVYNTRNFLFFVFVFIIIIIYNDKKQIKKVN